MVWSLAKLHLEYPEPARGMLTWAMACASSHTVCSGVTGFLKLVFASIAIIDLFFQDTPVSKGSI